MIKWLSLKARVCSDTTGNSREVFRDVQVGFYLCLLLIFYLNVVKIYSIKFYVLFCILSHRHSLILLKFSKSNI